MRCAAHVARMANTVYYYRQETATGGYSSNCAQFIQVAQYTFNAFFVTIKDMKIFRQLIYHQLHKNDFVQQKDHFTSKKRVQHCTAS